MEMRLPYLNVLMTALWNATAIILELAVVMKQYIHCDISYISHIYIADIAAMSFLLAPPCTESDVRLLNNRVQICHNEVWGYVCENFDWTDDDASVVCRELGFTRYGEILVPYLLCLEVYLHTLLTVAQGSYASIYEPSTIPFLLSGPNCSGSEDHLSDCPLSAIGNIAPCPYASTAICAG